MSESSRLDARYGRRPRDPRRVRLLAALGVLALVGLATVLYVWSNSGSDPTYVVGGYQAVSATQMRVTFSVEKAADQRVSCRVVAMNRFRDVVGSVDVDVSEKGTQIGRTVAFPTRELGVVGTVDSCRVLG